MAACPYGKASIVFPLCVSARTALGVLAATEGIPEEPAEVVGYTTDLTTEAGACSVRLSLQRPAEEVGWAPGNYVAAVRAEGQDGWIPGLANTKHHAGGRLGLEVVVLGRPSTDLKAAMYLSEATLRALWPCGPGMAQVRLLQPLLMPQMADCPGQWLRDRLLKLADRLEDQFEASAPSAGAEAALGEALRVAGLRLGEGEGSQIVGPADAGARMDDTELGYWKEEMEHGVHCAGAMEGSVRQDVPDEILAAML
mmetsp:Transcript_126483/g.282744  ORF Transcript_126483/g.282744 Transcript_126483/m.282744 type:complete len:254 (-) Transcript_126483:95-856(-)